MRKILITGGCGFQGSHLAEYLANNNNEVTIINNWSPNSEKIRNKYLQLNKNINVMWESINTDFYEPEYNDSDIIIHLAGVINPPNNDYGPNITSDITMFNFSKKYNIPLYYISSASVYGIPTQTKINEDHPLNPIFPYAISKYMGDQLGKFYFKKLGAPVTIIRTFNIYGPRQKQSGFGSAIPIFFNKAINNEVLNITSNGRQQRDYLYITDLINAYDIIINESDLIGKIINLGSGIGIEIKQLAQKIIDIVGSGFLKLESQDNNLSKDLFIANNNLLTSYGFKPKISIDEGLSYYWDWLNSK